MDPPILYDPTKHAHLIPSLASLHAECITSPPYTIASFLPPLSLPRMEAWWTARAAEVAAGSRHIIMQLARNPETGKEEVAGYVMLAMPESETGPFRGGVEKLLVSPRWRERGIARRVMRVLEDVANREGRGLLMLGTTKGSPAEFIYPRLGYIKIGEIPGHEISPVDGSLKDEVLFYKDLR
ncbi:acetyltransferase [Cadophora sp. DSE1049]|nr:acetyltransferase [Cadophora sp. DSE1049]